jgi:hypothetical protein
LVVVGRLGRERRAHRASPLRPDLVVDTLVAGGRHEGNLPGERVGGVVVFNPELNLAHHLIVRPLLEAQVAARVRELAVQVARGFRFRVDLARQVNPHPGRRPRLRAEPPDAPEDARDEGARFGPEDFAGLLQIPRPLPD